MLIRITSHSATGAGMVGQRVKEPLAEHDQYWNWLEPGYPRGAVGSLVKAVGITEAAAGGPRRAEAEAWAASEGVSVVVERLYKITLRRKYQAPGSRPWVYQCEHSRLRRDRASDWRR